MKVDEKLTFYKFYVLAGLSVGWFLTLITLMILKLIDPTTGIVAMGGTLNLFMNPPNSRSRQEEMGAEVTAIAMPGSIVQQNTDHDSSQ